jgi:hypothetical protein
MARSIQIEFDQVVVSAVVPGERGRTEAEMNTAPPVTRDQRRSVYRGGQTGSKGNWLGKEPKPSPSGSGYLGRVSRHQFDRISDPQIPLTRQESRLRASRRIFRPLNQEPAQFAGERAMERNPSGSSLECLDEEHTCTRIHIAHAEAQRFSEAETGAIEDEH